jgi:hypothetical protein
MNNSTWQVIQGVILLSAAGLMLTWKLAAVSPFILAARAFVWAHCVTVVFWRGVWRMLRMLPAGVKREYATLARQEGVV